MSKRTLKRSRQRACNTKKSEIPFFDSWGIRWAVYQEKLSWQVIERVIDEEFQYADENGAYFDEQVVQS